MFQSRNRPSLTEWADRKPMIEQLYLEQNRTLEEVSAILAEDNFHATIRQYKTRLKSWGYDNKKIRADVWKAMSFGLSFLKRHNQQAVFSVPVRGGQVKEVGQELIGKQMRRTTGYFKDLTPVLNILAMNKVDISCTDLSTGKKSHYAHNDFSAIAALSPPLKGSTIIMHTSSEARQRTGIGQAANSFVPGSPQPAVNRPEALSTNPPRDVFNSPIRPSSKPVGSSMSPRSIRNQELTKSTASRSSDDFDIMSAFGQLCLDKSCSPLMRDALCSYVGTIFPTPLAGCLDEEKRKATQWVAYYISTLGPERNVVNSVRDGDRRCAMDVFKDLLIHHSRFIYPFCSSVIMVLGAEPPDNRLEEFLSDCCEVIDNHMRGQEMNYGSPFHVARALWLGQTDEINDYEDSFARSTENIGFIWGKDSPNYVVNQHYYAWLKLHKQNHAEAIGLLEELVPKSREILGEKHPVTINCFATLSRAYAESQNFGHAIDCLKTALDLLNEHSSLLHKYKDRLLRRLAGLLQNTGNLVDAEALYRQSLDFRLRYFGLASQTTWVAIDDIKTVLRIQNKLSEASQFESEMMNQWLAICYQSHVAENGCPPDWFCTACNQTSCDKQCQASPSSPNLSRPMTG